MSFLSILSGTQRIVSKVIGGAGPIAAAVYPPAAPIVAGIAGINALLNKIPQSMIVQEVAVPQEGQGAIKAQAVVNDFNAQLQDAEQILAMVGVALDFDANLLTEVINSQAATFNAMAKLQASFKLVPLATGVVGVKPS